MRARGRVVAVLGEIRAAALADFGEAVVQRLDQQRAALRVVEQVVLQVRVAAHDPDVAEHFIQHPCRAARTALGARFVEHRPRLFAEQADHDLAIREGRVVVGNLAQTGRGVGGDGGGRAMRIENLWCVHVRTTRRADTPCTGVGKRVGAILGKSVLLPGARLSFMGPERATRPSWPATGRRHSERSARSRAARVPFGRGLAARGVGFNGAIRGCLCIFRSLIQNGILTHDRVTRDTSDRSWGYPREPRQAWLGAISRDHSPSVRSVTVRLSR